jgi:hypothetical protein
MGGVAADQLADRGNTVAFKSYEDQAKLSVGLAILGGLAALGVLILMCRNFDAASFYVTYNRKSLWLPLLAGGLLVGLGAGTVGFLVGLNSAGQRRNKRSGLSWQGFFLNALVLTVVLAAAIFFVFTRNPVSLKG